MELAAFLQWDVDPELFSLGPVTVRWYGLLFALAFFLGFYFLRWIFRREGRPTESADSLLGYVLLGTVVGARLGHCLLYEPSYYFRHPADIIKVWEGGLASHGAVVGILLSLYLYSSRRPDQPYLWVLDRMALPTLLGACLVRIGNLFNSEILGKPTAVAWAFVFSRADSLPRHPVQVYEALTYGLILFALVMVYRKVYPLTRSGLLLGLGLVAVFTGRFFLEFAKVRQAAYGHDVPLSVGQWLSIPLVIVGAALLVRSARGGPSQSSSEPSAG